MSRTAEQQHMLSCLAWKKLRAWQRLPGSGSILEMVMREQSVSHSCTLVTSTIEMVLRNLLEQFEHSTLLSPCHVHTSLVSSVHKALLLHTPSLTTDDDNSLLREGPPMKQLTLKQLTEAHGLLRTLLASVLAYTRSTQQVRSSCTGCKGALVVSKRLRQLQSMLVLVLVRTGNMQMRLSQAAQGGVGVVYPGAFETGVWEWVMEVEAHDSELAAVARRLSLPFRRAEWGTRLAAFRQECTVWDEYALTHFHGRLLPGCSYLGCTNTSGTSEASLDMLLCSGCRRMRYCSVGCQQAAWVRGGHSCVCGSGGWAGSAGGI